MPVVGIRREDRLDEIGQAIALVVGRHDDASRRLGRRRRSRMRLASTIIQALRAADMHEPPAAGARRCVLLVVRLPSLVQPMGADQGLYAYVGERIRAGGLPYRDAWDQKPPAIHFTLRRPCARVWPSDARRAGAPISLAAAAVAWLLYRLAGASRSPAGRRGRGAPVPAAVEPGVHAAVAASVCGAVRDVHRGRRHRRVRSALARSSREGPATSRRMLGAGVLFGLAFAFKYNAARLSRSPASCRAAGCAGG